MKDERRERRVVVEIGKMFDREVPTAIEAEMSLLGSMILDPACIPIVGADVESGHYYNEAHRHIHKAIVSVFDETGTGDLVQIVDRLRARGVLAEVGGSEYLLELANYVPTSVNATHFARIVRGKARLRALIESCGMAVFDAYDLAEDPREVFDRAMERFTAIARDGSMRDTVTLPDAEARVMQDLAKGAPSMYRTGVSAFDEIADGIPRQGVVTLFGYPGGGKTTFALTVALNLAMGVGFQQRVPVRVVSFEQSAQRIAATLLTQRAKLPVHEWLNQGKAPNQFERDELQRVIDSHQGVDFAMYESNLDPNAIYAEALALRQRHDRGVLVVDYLQDIPPFGRLVDHTPRMTEAMRILARIARELGWLVIVVSQVDKAAGKANRRPTLTDGLGSSAIEQRSDFIAYVWRPHQREPRPKPIKMNGPMGEIVDHTPVERWRTRYQRTQFGVIKNKFGPCGTAEQIFEGNIMAFREATDEERQVWPDLRDEAGE